LDTPVVQERPVDDEVKPHTSGLSALKRSPELFRSVMRPEASSTGLR
jgi:hypothetical protein